MIIDKNLEFADALDLATAIGVANIGNVIDTGIARDVGGGQQMYCVFQVSTAVTSGGAATVQFQIVSDNTGEIAVDGTQSVHIVTGAIPVTSLKLGEQYVLPLPPQGSIPYERYLAVQQVTAEAVLTAGAFNISLVFDTPANFIAMPDGDK